MRFAAQVKKITEATKLLCKINGKFDRKAIMQEALGNGKILIKIVARCYSIYYTYFNS